MFSRIAIVNRGEPAMRLINAVREWNAENGPDRRLRTIALHTAVDRRAMYVREADEAVLIGPDDPDHMGASPYLDFAELERALRVSRAEAVWPGWGFVSEKAEFAELCARLGITFVGPSAEVMRRLGDKIASKQLAESVGVPMAPWSGGPVADLDAARKAAETVGYPLMVKATAGGGGRGIRFVAGPEHLDGAFERAASEASRTAGDATVFLERAVAGGRHVEVQVVADATGDVWTLGVRDCSVQRRNQKVIEESASTALDAEQERLLRDSAADLARAAGYVNAGTVEFLYQPEEKLLSFLEVSTRLQVEHPVTEACTGVDIVKLQLHVAAGGALAEVATSVPAGSGWAIEARLTAEDPEREFAPAPGRIEHLALPSGPGIRVDTGVAAGDVIPPQFDSMIAKVIAWGRDRDEARARLSRALRQTAAVIDGGSTNKAFLLDLLDRDELRAGDVQTTWLDGMMAQGYAPPRRIDVALLATAIQSHDGHVARQQDRLFRSAEAGRPEVGYETWHQTDVTVAGQSYKLRVARTRAGRYRVELDGTSVDVDVERNGAYERRITVGEQSWTVLSVAQESDYLVEVDGAVHRISGGEAGIVRAPAPAMVVALPVAPGDVVSEGDTVAIVESMKLETSLRAPFDGTVAELLVPANTQVDGGTKLVRLEPSADAEAVAAPTADRADFAAFTAAGTDDDPAATAADALSALRYQVLGFDVDESQARPQMRRLAGARARLADDDPAVLAGEVAVLRIFGDLCALSRNRSETDDVTGETERNPQEYLYAYLRSRDADDEGLPESFQAKLRTALAHYGVSDISSDPDLGPALYRMFLAHRRAPQQVPVVLHLLNWRLEHPRSLAGLSSAAREDYLRTLDELVVATQLRHPVVGDTARLVRYRAFDAPVVAAERSHALAELRESLDVLATDPATPDRARRIDALVASSESILGVFGERHDAVLLEVMTRRYYRVRPLRDLELTEHAGKPLLTARYQHLGNDRTLFASVIDNNDPAAAVAVAEELRRRVGELDGDRTALVDLYVTSTKADDGGDPDARAERVRAALGRVPAILHRVAVAVRPNPRAEHTAEAEAEAPTWFTFRPDETGELVEDRTLRGMHPLVADRLRLWRFRNFELTRVPAATDVHLFRAVGREVPGDDRLVAMADVRELTVLRDEETGRIRSLPQFERALDACINSLRSARANDRNLARLSWNRIALYVWPEVDVPLAELDQVVRRLAPRTAHLGLEQVLVEFRTADASVTGGQGGPKSMLLRMSRPPGAGLTLRLDEPPTEPMRELDDYDQKVLKARRRGAVYPYEIVPLLTAPIDAGEGTWQEYDLVDPDDPARPLPVDRAPGGNRANLVLGVVSVPTRRYPEGMKRVVLLGDPTRALGAIAEPECRRVLAAIDLARELDVPVEWFAVSAGAKIAMDSGTENMDWISRVLRGIIEFTQAGGEMNVVVTGINVGAQPYWNAEATMLMHTRGILVMTPDSAMVLTGKQSLDYSGGVSAEDNFGIGGYDRIMGPNGQAQYWAPDLSGAVQVLLRHYAHTWALPGERFPRPAPTTDPVSRDVTTAPHAGPNCEFTTLGEIWAEATNGERKKPFDIRSVLRGVADADHVTSERWADMHDAASVVALDAHLGGQPIAMVGIESRPIPRRGPRPVDGPSQFTAGTLFPRSSRKCARAINAASGNRPLVVLANLSGFDGSPESLRGLQLENGAEIGRAIVNFDGPIVFCVVSRYHGGAFVVFSGTLNDNMEVAAITGSYASVLGGAPAAAVVFAGEVKNRVAADERITVLEGRIAEASEAGDEAVAARLRGELAALRPDVRSEKLGQVADEFDTKHSIERAQSVGSVHRIVTPDQLRPYLADAVARGMKRTLDRRTGDTTGGRQT
ncbi:Methylcrotonyl-CoA carboxylase biotin-containing subunit [Pseudonocardia sp. Ae168_Ps1]|uniref:ATP-binding protein n=1 Tax=unclassified Pseudonocardia TaxID=2619320 RepID=UPI00094B1ABA|nr:MULTISPECIES: biotin carboxylase N-terminal domain-containing protein [unclassified Pseudonocardia]OLL76180.1 Methylcrotonyl-CoA carboxylase biotin-containing subunit [Pseudonocardia sp. Ae150A_Ps1]OLL82179.1 Methylcrotonyl-CoA carboxylase biotin-containing subunit [Pseudonocardia sp. Ae168_Ps1]OLL83706.1 Methylcrotonyl-CoA carboxylase biotin-containing subunit [Pseudonocardia sp. Ae263_Ps1]OLL90253.1 Methylcrotonyl-CoA carboxylase biotin-containing subunit [Pseudonocardia sp. Ae356_Ps1]